MNQRPGTNGGRELKTVRTATEVIDALLDGGPCGVTELATRLSLPKSTVYTQLNTLRNGGFVTKDGDEYQLSYKFLTLGEYVRNETTLYQVARTEVDRLADETGQYAHLVTEEHGRGIDLYKARGETGVGDTYQATKLQRRDHLHITASGKAILAHLPRQRVDEIVDEHGLGGRTDETITDRETLYERLSEIRERGYAYNDEEEVVGLRAVGAPIRRADGAVLGSISVSGPTSFVQGDRFETALPELVTSAANVIEVNINMDDMRSELSETGSR
ncbi:IclR family transcriptional regulator [Salinigranum marinum]|uniref:IclR family transcriptional regulator n=1 Tax=Salinigranum marinum TaxID=1515595 RepID=UPI002989C21B|nr:IclR family transcriptional regulator [Salinigranum marinum]